MVRIVQWISGLLPCTCLLVWGYLWCFTIFSQFRGFLYLIFSIWWRALFDCILFFSIWVSSWLFSTTQTTFVRKSEYMGWISWTAISKRSISFPAWRGRLIIISNLIFLVTLSQPSTSMTSNLLTLDTQYVATKQSRNFWNFWSIRCYHFRFTLHARSGCLHLLTPRGPSACNRILARPLPTPLTRSCPAIGPLPFLIRVLLGLRIISRHGTVVHILCRFRPILSLTALDRVVLRYFNLRNRLSNHFLES